jgi:isoleucyl-tRNA synthetase
MPVREHVLKSLETARQEKFIGAPLEARVRLTANGDLYPLLDKYAGELPGLFIVSQVALEQGTGGELSIQVEKADGAKCERCWKYLAEVGENANFPTLCGSCVEVVESTLAG